MASSYLQQLTAVSSVASGYLIPISDDPSGSGTLKNATFTQIGTWIDGRYGSGISTFLANPSSLNLCTALTDKTGSGVVVFSENPSFSGIIVNGDFVSTHNGSSGNSPFLIQGLPHSGGTSASTLPTLFIQPSISTPVVAWSTGGTMIGINMYSTFNGNLIHMFKAGSSLFKIDYTGALTSSAGLTAGTTSAISFSTSRSKFYSSSDGKITLSNSTDTGFTSLLFGGTTSAFPSLYASGNMLRARLANDSADCGFSASSGFFSSTLAVTGKSTFNAVDTSAQLYTPASGTTATLNLALGNLHEITMPTSGNITIALSNDTNNQAFEVGVTWAGTGTPGTVTWFSTIRWAGGSAPTLTAVVSKRDRFVFRRTGASTYDGMVAGQNI